MTGDVLTDELVLSEGQQKAYDHAMAGDNVFITGPGGVGKSVVLNQIIDSLRDEDKEVAVTAYTGIAALQVGGSTIHSYLGTRIFGCWDAVDDALLKGVIDLEGRHHYILDQLNACEVLIVDEVSMMTGDYVDMMDRWLKFARGSTKPFGGIQVILSGDFLQLAPVIRSDDQIEVEHAFYSKAWTEADLKPVSLVKCFRQEDQELIDNLLKVRMGIIEPGVLAYFNQFVDASRGWDVDPTWLTTHNNKANNRNIECLNRLEGWQTAYNARFEGRDMFIKMLKKNCIADEVLRVKEGALVMLIKNDRERRFMNGTRAEVVKLHMAASSGKEDKDTVTVVVEVDGEEETQKLTLARSSWEFVDHTGSIKAVMRQIPLKLAWAITIHKSQGMTLNRVSCNLADCFATGQAYTALSRVSSAAGLSLERPITGSEIATNKAAVKFYNELL